MMTQKKSNASTDGATGGTNASGSTRSTSKGRGSQGSNNGPPTSTGSSSRSNSQPKSRSRTPSKQPPGSTSGKNKEVLPPTLSAHEQTLLKTKKSIEGKSVAARELLLQETLQRHKFADAAYLIAACDGLSEKYKTSDVVRLLIDAKQLDQAGKLIRDFKLQGNQLLVTLYIKELVRCGHFHAAVRSAQDMVQNFGKKDFGPRDQARPSWTPQALVQAMVRAQQYRTALKFAHQFGLSDVFPAKQLVAGMFESRNWSDAVSSVMEHKLFTDFPLESLIIMMLEVRQWTCAIKCISKLPSRDLAVKYEEALVREAARVGDFVSSITYLRDFKLTDPTTHGDIHRYIVDCLVVYREFYKAIKYSIKFGLAGDENESVVAAPSEPNKYATTNLIRQAIAYGQYNVAALYITKLKLKDQFVNELALISDGYEAMARDFRSFIAHREAQWMQPTVQLQLKEILGRKGVEDELVDGEPKEVDVVISEEEEIVPREPKKQAKEQPPPSTEDDDEGEDVILLTQVSNGAQMPLESTPSSAPTPPTSQSKEKMQSRFTFARSVEVPPQPSNASSGIRSPPPPPGLGGLSSPPGVTSSSPSNESSATTSSFDFSQFASSFQNSQPAPMPAQQRPSPSPPTSGYQPQPSSNSNIHRPPPPPPLPPHMARGPIGFPSGPTPPPPPPPPLPLAYGQSQQFYYRTEPPHMGAGAPPPPLPPSTHAPNSSGHGAPRSFDAASLAMQFHSFNTSPAPKSQPPFPGYNNAAYGPRMPSGPAPPLPPPPSHFSNLFPSPPPPPPPFAAASPSSTFKASVTYTSVTTRQKR
ncbi:TPA: hypothetical protein N0F65_003788 [Lagenidium giganteum]|uniref:Uncharacterized protein n=1 Tax=Lagenidium giganteum TaxID=4803 RepID=A0AAV2Y9Y0_9STRA|nr:TPA: hypothetical protein N0F65_003788 [Lagenidium giganteum]